jgi:DNA polymerase-3 subunit epsilon
MNSLINAMQKRYYRSRLKDERFAFLFDESDDDTFVCFDTETTGLSPRKDEIISIGAVKIQNGKILASQKLELFIKPCKKLDQKSITIHRLRHIDLQNGIDIEHAIERFLYFIGSSTLVGYYLEFDVAMINKYLKSILGIKLPNKQIEVSTLYYRYKAGPVVQRNVDLRFDSIMKDLDLPFFGKHDAINDAIMTSMIYLKLKNSLH